MFNDDQRNSSSSDSFSSVDTKLSFDNGELSSPPGNVPIHTMKKDLKNINNPQYFNDSDANNEPVELTRSSFTPAKTNSSPRTSPFLSQNINKGGGAPSVSSPKKESITINDGPTPHTPSSWGKLILIACFIFLLFAAGAGGYYFWMNKMNVKQTSVIKNTPPVKVTLALDKPNYLNIDSGDGNINITSAIDKYVKEVMGENPTTPVEFMVVDSQNNPISFKNFSARSNITLPADITNFLKDSFSFFIYLDEEKPRVGLAIDSDDLIGTNLKEALAKNESSMVEEMKPIYLSSSVSSTSNAFNTSYYGGAEIRFKNIETSEGMSLDYTIFRDKLIIGTSKMTLRSIIDYLTANVKVKGVEDVIENVPEEDLQNGKI